MFPPHLLKPSLLNYVPFVPTRLTYLRALNYYVPTWLRLLCTYVPTCHIILSAYRPACTHFLRAYVLTCIYIYFCICMRSCLKFLVPTYVHFSRAYVPTTTHQTYWGSLLYLVLLYFSRLFNLSFYSKPQNKLLLKLHAPILSCGVLLS